MRALAAAVLSCAVPRRREARWEEEEEEEEGEL